MKEKIKLHPDVMISVVSLIFAAVLLIEIHGYPDDVKMFPSIFLYMFVVAMAVILVQGVRKTLKPGIAAEAEFWCKMETIRNPLITAAFVIAYVALMGLIGFYAASFIYLCTAMYYFGSKNWKVNLMVAAVLMIFCYLLFNIALSVTLPLGMLFERILG